MQVVDESKEGDEPDGAKRNEKHGRSTMPDDKGHPDGEQRQDDANTSEPRLGSGVSAPVIRIIEKGPPDGKFVNGPDNHG